MELMKSVLFNKVHGYHYSYFHLEKRNAIQAPSVLGVDVVT